SRRARTQALEIAFSSTKSDTHLRGRATRDLRHLSLDPHHGFTDNFVTKAVASLKFFAYQLWTVAFFVADGIVDAWIKWLTDSLYTFYAQFDQRILELLDDAVYTFDILVLFQVFRYMLKSTLKIID